MNFALGGLRSNLGDPSTNIKKKKKSFIVMLYITGIKDAPPKITEFKSENPPGQNSSNQKSIKLEVACNGHPPWILK